MNETSLSLLEQARGDAGSDSWNRLVSIYTPLIHNWLRKYSVQESDADNLLQEVLLTVARELSEFEHSGRKGAFRKWLRTILVNRLRNFWRDSRRNRVMALQDSVLSQLTELADDSSQISQLWDAEHDRHVLMRLLEQVRPRFEEKTWEAFQRQMFHGENGRVIADNLGMSLKAVQLAKSRVLNALRSVAGGLIDSV